MARVKSEIRTIFEGEGIVNSDALYAVVLENNDLGNIDITNLLARANGKFAKIVITTIVDNEVPTIDEKS